MFSLIVISFFETILMVSTATVIGLGAGIPLGSLLFYYSKKRFYPILSFLINTLRSIPYIIMMIVLIPVTRCVLGTSIGTGAAIFPLAIAAILLIARAAEEAMHTVPQELLDIGYKATYIQRFKHIIFPEAFPFFLKNIIGIIINLIGFSAMSGTVGGGGLGDLAYRYGYQRYDVLLILIIVTILVLLVQIVQIIGNWFYERLYS